MTRINVVPVKELSDQHLIAEYHELPRVIKQNINTENAPDRYKLGEGHVRWARAHAKYCMERYEALCKEMTFRGFKVTHTAAELYKLYIKLPRELHKYYLVTNDAILINRERLIERSQGCKWTKRRKPWYYHAWLWRLFK